MVPGSTLRLAVSELLVSSIIILVIVTGPA